MRIESCESINQVSRTQGLFSTLKDPVWIFAFALLVGYTLLSIVAYSETGNLSYRYVMVISFVAAIVVILTSRVAWLKGFPVLRRISIERNHFLLAVFAIFFLLASYLIVSAPGIPLLAWVNGADQTTLVTMREEFLKARSGWESFLPYANSIVAGVMIPYAIAEMFLCRHRWRWLLFCAFFVYCLLFIEKVYFLKAMVPLACVVIMSSRLHFGKLFVFISSGFLVLYILGYISGFGAEEYATFGSDYFSNSYRPSGILGYLIWRSISVPLFTAADYFSYFHEVLNSNHLFGMSSGAMALLFDQDRVFLERDVFAYQWGQTETGTGSSNCVYFVDAYVNFGWVGVVIFSAGVAGILKYFSRSDDKALFCLWPLLFFSFYLSGFINSLLSGGFIFIMIFSMLFRLEDRKKCCNDSVSCNQNNDGND